MQLRTTHAYQLYLVVVRPADTAGHPKPNHSSIQAFSDFESAVSSALGAGKCFEFAVDMLPFSFRRDDGDWITVQRVCVPVYE